MVRLTIDPSTTKQGGGITLTGTTTPEATLIWWLNDEAGSYSHGFTREGDVWQLDLPLSANVFTVNVLAEDAGVKSEIVSYLFDSKSGVITPSYEFNSIDEMALVNGILRIPGETNTSLRARALAAYALPGNATKEGQNISLNRELGLPDLEEFFFLSSRYNILTGEVHKKVFIAFHSDRVEVQVADWVAIDELLEVDPLTYIASTHSIIGGEIPSLSLTIKVTNAGQIIPDNAIRVTGPKEITIDPTRVKLNLDSPVLITYPYMAILPYTYTHETTKAEITRTVQDVKQWITTIATVTENNVQVPLIVWNDGTLVETTDEPTTGFSSYPMEQLSINNPGGNKYVQLTNDIVPKFYEYVNKYPAKSFFKATQIRQKGQVELVEEPIQYGGNWAVMNALADDVFIESLRAEKEYTNLSQYATTLRHLVRMGIASAIVNKDYWDSDTPAIIGDNFIPSKYDKGLGTHSIVTDDGSVLNLTLNQRRYYASKLGMLD